MVTIQTQNYYYFCTKAKRVKIKEIWNWIRGSFLYHVFKSKYVIVTAIFVVWAGFLDSESALRCSRIRANIGTQQEEIDFYLREIEAIEQKLKQLNSNRDSLERFARENYYFKEKEEDLFVVQPKRK